MLQIGAIQPPDDVVQHRMDQVVRGIWEHPVRLESGLPRPQKALCPLSAHAVVMDVAEKAHPVERTEDVPFLATGRDAVLQKKRLQLLAGQHVGGQTSQKLFEFEVSDMRGDLGEILVGDFGGSLVHHPLEAELTPPLVWRECGQALANGHQVTRAKQRVPVDELKTSLFLARVSVGDCRPPQEGLERIGAQPLRAHHGVALQQAHIVVEDLAEALAGVCDVDRAAAVLLGHYGGLRKTRIGLFAHSGKYLDVMVDPAKLIGNLHQTELCEVPYVRRQLAGDAGMARWTFDVLVEVFIDAIDEDGHRQSDLAQTRHQMAVSIGNRNAGARSE
jgi:hypothetical protein